MSENSKYLENLAAQVAAGLTIKAAAVVVGCSESHAYTLSGSGEFKRRVSDLRSQATSAAVGKLSDAAGRAVDVLVELLSDDNEPKDRLAAAKSILQLMGPISELAELRARIDALEASTK